MVFVVSVVAHAAVSGTILPNYASNERLDLLNLSPP